MIGSALQFVAKRIDDMIRQRLKAPPGSRKVILSPIMDIDGSIAAKEENVLLFSLISIQKNSIPGSPAHQNHATSRVSMEQAPPVHLNLFVLLGAYFKGPQIQEGLDTLSIAISFLQGMPLWNSQTAPGLPIGIEKLIFELESPDFHQQSHIWGTIGAKYMPSVIYKVRTIIVDDGTINQMVPTIGKVATDAS